MKDWFMIFVLAAVAATPFFPFLLKSKCPACSKRKLETLETVCCKTNPDNVEDTSVSYLTFYKCHACEAYFKRCKSEPPQDSSSEEYERLKAGSDLA